MRLSHCEIISLSALPVPGYGVTRRCGILFLCVFATPIGVEETPTSSFLSAFPFLGLNPVIIRDVLRQRGTKAKMNVSTENIHFVD